MTTITAITAPSTSRASSATARCTMTVSWCCASRHVVIPQVDLKLINFFKAKFLYAARFASLTWELAVWAVRVWGFAEFAFKELTGTR